MLGLLIRDGRCPLKSSLFFIFLYILKIIYLFYFLTVVDFVVAFRLSPEVSRGYTSLWCSGFLWWWLFLLWSTGSRHAGFGSCSMWLSSCGLQALEHGLSSCGTWAQLLCSMWDLPRPGIERVSLALQEGFLATGPPGKPLYSLFLLLNEPIDFQLKFLYILFVFELFILKRQFWLRQINIISRRL